MRPEDEAGLGSALGSSAEVEPDPSSSSSDDDAIEQTAADDVMEAMKSGDKIAFRDALKTFVALVRE